MAQVVPKDKGMRKSPCVECNHPVFFAERLVINSLLYHRTCFKCARCSSVLTLGNYYETENDNEYCCETCPDEEKVNSAKVETSNRLSIAQRIALFEKESSSVLKKSLSDEEKSKSLIRQAPANTEALNSFLVTQIDRPRDSEEDNTVDSISSDSESDDEKHTAPLSDESITLISDKNKEISDHKEESYKNFLVTKELSNSQDFVNKPSRADFEAIADRRANNSESQNEKASAHLVLLDKKEPLLALQDDIELEFEKLAEEALVPTTVPLVSVKKDVIVEKVEKEETEICAETEVKDENASHVEVQENDNLKKESLVESTDKSVNIEVLIEAATPTAEHKTAFIYNPNEASTDSVEQPSTDQSKSVNDSDYPDDLDPFGDEEKENTSSILATETSKRRNLNPFDSCSEDEEDNVKPSSIKNSETLAKPPRPPLPKNVTLKSTNPFGSEDEDEDLQKPSSLRTPVPTPRRANLYVTIALITLTILFTLAI